MDAQELSNLQEAYLEVYGESEGFRKYPKKRVGEKIDRMYDDPNIDTVFGNDARRRSEMLRVYKDMKNETHPLIRVHSPKKSKAASAANRNRPASEKRSKIVSDNSPKKSFPNRLMRSDGQGITDSYDIYDVILSHLLDEGYAETPEAAEVIMVNMSEEWREVIVEAYWPWDKPKPNSPSPRDRAALRQSQQQNSRTPAGQERSQQIANVRTNMRQGINKTAERTQTDPRREGTAPFTKRHIDAAMRTGGTAGGKMFAPPSGGPRSTGIPSTRIPASPQLRAANQAAQFRRGGSGSAEGLGSSSGLRGSSPSGTTGRFQVGGGRGYGLGYIKLAN